MLGDEDGDNLSLLYRFADVNGRNYPALHRAILYGRSVQELRGMVEYDIKFQSAASCRTVMISSMDDVCVADDDDGGVGGADRELNRQVYHGEATLHMLIYKALYATKPCISYIQNTNLLKELADACPRVLSVTDDKGDSPFMLILSCPRLSGAVDEDAERKHESDDTKMIISSLHREKLVLEAMKVCFEINPSLAWYKCVWRNNVLHYALLSGRSHEFIRYILSILPPEEGVLGSNRRGEYPLHICAKTGEYNTTDVMMVLLQMAPEVSAIQDEQGLTPIHWAWIRHACGCPLKAGDFVPDNIYDILIEADASILTLDDMECFSSLMETLGILLQASYRHCAQDRQISWRIVHAAAAVCCPRAVLKLAIKHNPEQVWEQDENGKTALALASSLPEFIHWIFRGGLFGQPLTNVPEIIEEHPVSILLREYPDACRIADFNGRLPLHLAIEKCHQTSQLKERMQIVKELLNAFPGSICVRDQQTGFYPFMLAAVNASDNGTSTSAKDESASQPYGYANSEQNECGDDASQESSFLSWISGCDFEIKLFSRSDKENNESIDDWIDEVMNEESASAVAAARMGGGGESSMSTLEPTRTHTLSDTNDDDVLVLSQVYELLLVWPSGVQCTTLCL